MECPHLCDDVKIDRLFVRNKIKIELNAGTDKPLADVEAAPKQPAVLANKRSSPDSTTKPGTGTAEKHRVGWRCLECASEKENWMCLNCGKILCGRYVNSHALKHSDGLASGTHHKLCMNTLNQSVYCYKCDDFVINETRQLDELRQEFQSTTCSQSSLDHDAEEEEEETTTNHSSVSSHSGADSKSTCSSTKTNASSALSTGRGSLSTDSGWTEENLGRRLRPRKRTISSDSSTQEAKEVSSTSAVAVAAAAPSPVAKRTKSSATRRVVGLRNLGNTCFMNSVLQSLSNIQEFSSYFYTLPSMEQIKQQRKKAGNSGGSGGGGGGGGYISSSFGSGTMNGGVGLSARDLEDANVVEELRKVLLNLGQGGDGSKAISPECLFVVIWKVVPQFRGHRQHDAHEFLRYMLDRLHTELQQNAFPPVGSFSGSGGGAIGSGGVGSAKGGQGTVNGSCPVANNGEGCYGGSKRSSIVTNVFGGVLQSEVRCLICGMDSKKHDPFLDLSLDIPEKFYSKEATANGSDEEKKPECHILDCLQSFTEVEELAETELYYCNSCKCKQKSTKRFWIRRLPNVLCLHIKRFRWSNFFRTKIDLRISFPLKSLDMSQFVLNSGPETRRSNSSNNIYDLAAVIVHHGNGSSCGHYTSYAYSGGTWLHFNDHTVKEVPYTTVADCKPYILFYTRRDNSSNKSASPTSTS